MLTKLTIDIQYASPAIEAAVAKVASITLIKKWVRAATGYGGLLTLRFVNATEGKKLNFSFRKRYYFLSTHYSKRSKRAKQVSKSAFRPPHCARLPPCSIL